jgi:hypothetical protein
LGPKIAKLVPKTVNFGVETVKFGAERTTIFMYEEVMLHGVPKTKTLKCRKIVPKRVATGFFSLSF